MKILLCDSCLMYSLCIGARGSKRAADMPDAFSGTGEFHIDINFHSYYIFITIYKTVLIRSVVSQLLN